MIESADLLGLVVADVYYVSSIGVFASRLLHRPEIGHAIGYLQMVCVLPLVYLLLAAPGLQRPVLYYIQAGLLILFILVETLLDYIWKIDFRHTNWMVISYVVLFFAATGGMLGLANRSGLAGTLSAVALYLVMATLAFIQRSVTGL